MRYDLKAMPRGRLHGMAMALLALLALLILTPAGSKLRGFVSEPRREAATDHRDRESGAEDSTTTPSKTDRHPPRPRPTVEDTTTLLKSTIIPETHFVDLTLFECITSLNDLIKNAGVDRRDLRIVPSERLTQQTQGSDQPWHEVKLKNVPVATVLQYLLDVRGLRYRIGQGIVEMRLMDEPDEETPSQKLVRAKLNAIIIPRIDFHDTTIEEAIDFLRQRGRELDHSSTLPERKGVSFVIRKPRLEGSSTSSDAELDAEGGLGDNEPGARRIKRWQAENIPLADALDELTRRAGLRWKIDDYSITILPADTGIPLNRHPKAPPANPDDPFGRISDKDEDPFAP